MRRTLLAALTAAMLLSLAAPALAHPDVELEAAMPADLTHASTDNVELLGRFPEHWGTAGGRVVGERFYLTDPRGVYVYDISDPASPVLEGSIALFQQTLGAALAQEEPDTDGNILLVDGSTSPVGGAQLHVIDVSDPANMSVLGTLGTTDHTWTCVTAEVDGEVNGCAFAYGRTGHIVDLTDPTEPELLDGTWREAVDYGTRSNSPYAHDLTEVRPGLVMSAGRDAILMDTTDPAAPIRLAAILEEDREEPWHTFGYHSTEWAQEGRDRFLLAGTEIAPAPVDGLPNATNNTAGSDCDDDQSVIETWDTTAVLDALEQWERLPAAARSQKQADRIFADADFVFVDAFNAGDRGIFLTGNAPGHVLYCAHWMRPSPDFADGGVFAVSYYDRGTRFVEVGPDGMMAEVGWMVAAEGYSGSPRWVSEDIVYVSDYRRGLEILRLAPDEATGVQRSSAAGIAVGSSYVPPSAIDLGQASTALLGLFGFLMLGTELRRRRRVAA